MTTVFEQRPPGPAPLDPWTERKLALAGLLGRNCTYPDCTDEREQRPAGRTGRPTKFCTRHNNPKDRQVAYRAELKRLKEEKERAAARPVPTALPQVIASRAYNVAVLVESTERQEAAVGAILDSNEALLEADRVVEHITAVQDEAAEQVRVAEEERDGAIAKSTADTEKTQVAEGLAAASALAQHAAEVENLTAQKEAAAADEQATRDRQALELERARLTEAEQRHTQAVDELRQSHQQALEQEVQRFAELKAQHEDLSTRHTALALEYGRLDGELTTVKAQFEALGEQHQQQEADLRAAAAAQATAKTRITGLEQQLAEQKAERTRESDDLRRQLADRSRELTERRTHVEELRSATLQEDVPPTDTDVTAPAEEETAPVATKAQPRTVLQEIMANTVARDPYAAPAAIIDLGAIDGSGWSMVCLEAGHDNWVVLRDGEHVGSVEPGFTRSYKRSGWSAKHQGFEVKPYGKPFYGNKEDAGRAVAHSALRSKKPHHFVPAPEWTALSAKAADDLVAATLPLATATLANDQDRARGGRLALLPAEVRAAALRMATRAPRPGDLALLRGTDPKALGRNQAALRFLAAVLPPSQDAAIVLERRDLGQMDGHGWILEPDPQDPARYRVLADGQVTGTLTPQPGGQWSAIHRRRTLASPGNRPFVDLDAALLAVRDAEREYRPLPRLDLAVWRTVPDDLRRPLRDAAAAVDPSRGRLSQLTPDAYRDAVRKALLHFAKNTFFSPRELAVLLDVPREELGPDGSEVAQALFEALRRIRDEHIAPPSRTASGGE